MVWPVVEAERATFRKGPDAVQMSVYIIDLGVCHMDNNRRATCKFLHIIFTAGRLD